MTRIYQVLLILLALSLPNGCANRQEELRSEKETRLHEQAYLRELMNKNDPPGRPGSTHPDTKSLLDRVDKADARIREIDSESWK